MMEAVLAVNMPACWVKDFTDKYQVPIKILDCVPSGEEGGRSLFEISAEKDSIDDISKDISSHPDVTRVELTSIGDGKAKGSIVTRKCSVCETIMRSDCFLRSARSLKDGRIEWTIVCAGDGALSELMERLKRMNCQAEIIKVTRVDDDSAITKRQEEIIRTAYDLGYFDFPRKITVRDLAKRIDISPSTLGEILQRGERKIIEDYLKGER